MLYAGIDITKSIHDCYILSVQRTILTEFFTFLVIRKGEESLEKSVQKAQYEENDYDLTIDCALRTPEGLNLDDSILFFLF